MPPKNPKEGHPVKHIDHKKEKRPKLDVKRVEGVIYINAGVRSRLGKSVFGDRVGIDFQRVF